MLMVSPRLQGEQDYSAAIGAILPYEYRDCWLTGGTKKRGEEYYRLKEEVKGTIIDRLCAGMGEGFRQAIKYSVAATPLTFERYTNNERGAIFGWQPSKKGFGSFIPFKAPVDNMYFVGHWTYPGGGVPAAAASGYYVAARILKKEGIDLEAKVKAFGERQRTAAN